MNREIARRAVGTGGGDGWMRGPCACPRAQTMHLLHAIARLVVWQRGQAPGLSLQDGGRFAGSGVNVHQMPIDRAHCTNGANRVSTCHFERSEESARRACHMPAPEIPRFAQNDISPFILYIPILWPLCGVFYRTASSSLFYAWSYIYILNSSSCTACFAFSKAASIRYIPCS